MTNDFATCLTWMRDMNVNRHRGRVAPHKPALLLAVIDEVERGRLTNGFVPPSEEMEWAFLRVWRWLVGDDSHFKPTFATPFYHLGSEPFWELMARKDVSIR